MAIKPRNSRSFTITTADNGDTLDLGAASTPEFVSTMMVQLVPDGSFSGSITVVGRLMGPAAAAATWEAIPYRSVSSNNTAGDYTMGHAAITTEGIIAVPASGMAIGLLTTISAGTCKVYTWDLQGPAAP